MSVRDRLAGALEAISYCAAQFRYLNGLPDLPEGSRLVNLACIEKLARAEGLIGGIAALESPETALNLVLGERHRCAMIAERVGAEVGSTLVGNAIAREIRVSSESALISKLAIELRKWACEPRDSDGVGECNICHRQGLDDFHGENCPLKGLPE